MTSMSVPRCPVSWARGLRRNFKLAPRERIDAAQWIEYSGWQYCPVQRGWLDPGDGDDWGIEAALRIQLRCEAAYVLAGHGWELIGAAKWATRARPIASRGCPSHAVSIATALVHVGAGHNPPARPRSLAEECAR